MQIKQDLLVQLKEDGDAQVLSSRVLLTTANHQFITVNDSDDISIFDKKIKDNDVSYNCSI